ncbi:MAG: manganese-dependent inorganic pyrophosphatase, partial [archaeon]
MVVYVVGHKNPDSDSVCAAIAVADLKNKLGDDVVACVQGELNPETKFVLEKFGVDIPEIIEDGSGKDLILVDHSDVSQSVDNLGKAEIVGIVDHHKLGDVTTSFPVDVLIRPVGSTCTIVKSLYDYYEKKISKKIAGIMLCAILSDTVIFKSATTTDEDRIVAEELAKIAGVKGVEKLGMEMLKVKSAIEGVSAKDLVMRDFKDFDMSGNRIGIGQLELVDFSVVDKIRGELFEEIKKLKEDGRQGVLFMLTDIM